MENHLVSSLQIFNSHKLLFRMKKKNYELKQLEIHIKYKIKRNHIENMQNKKMQHHSYELNH